MNESIRERIARIKAEKALALQTLKATQSESQTEPESESISPSLQKALDVITGSTAQKIILNANQAQAVSLAASGQSFCLAGAAGTGKTTSTREIISRLLESNHVKPFSASTKYLAAGAPGIIVTAFTKRATKNAEEAINDPLVTCINFHKLLQYVPTYPEVLNEKGEIIKTVRFEPTFHKLNPLPHISTIIIDESSQFSIPMFDTLWDALSAENKKSIQFIFIGDIQQIPPTMGMSIYGPKLNELPSIELTEVYRQALESPIIRFLTDMRSGHTITRNDWRKYTRNEDGTPNNEMRMGVFPANLDWEEALHQAASFLRQEFESGIYNPYEDMVLVPFNVKFGTVALNKAIAEMLDQKEARTIYQVIVGWARHHYAIGDHVLFNTQDYVITAINPNPKYSGASAAFPSKFIDRDGSVTNRVEFEKEQRVHDIEVLDSSLPLDSLPVITEDQKALMLSEDHKNRNNDPLSLDQFLQVQLAKSINEKTNTASHIITLRSLDDPEEPLLTIDSVGDLMKMILSYAITVHKAQGLQAQRVYFFLHSAHSPMHFRELIYTAASRAKKYLTIICDPKTLARGIEKQRIPGVTLEEKKLYFIERLGSSKEIKEIDDALSAD